MTVLIESRIWYLERYSTDKTVIKVDVGKIDTIIPIPQTLMDRIRKICEYIVGYFIFILSYTKLKLLESRLLLAKTTLPIFLFDIPTVILGKDSNCSSAEWRRARKRMTRE